MVPHRIRFNQPPDAMLFSRLSSLVPRRREAGGSARATWAPQDRDPRGLCDGRPSSNSWPARSIWVTISLRPTLLSPIADAVSVALQSWQSHQREGRTRRRTFIHVEGIGFYRGPRPPPRVSRTHLAAAQDQHAIREGDQGCACSERASWRPRAFLPIEQPNAYSFPQR